MDETLTPRTQALCSSPHRAFYTRRCVRCAALVRRCKVTVMRTLFTIWIGLDYLSSEPSHRDPNLPNSQDLRTAQKSHSPVACGATRRTGKRCVKHKACSHLFQLAAFDGVSSIRTWCCRSWLHIHTHTQRYDPKLFKDVFFPFVLIVIQPLLGAVLLHSLRCNTTLWSPWYWYGWTICAPVIMLSNKQIKSSIFWIFLHTK